MEQLIILIIIGLISLVNWLMEKSAEQRRKKREARFGQGETSYSPPEPEPAETSEAELRKFLEALGMPAQEPYQPPPPAPRPVVVEPAPVKFYQKPAPRPVGVAVPPTAPVFSPQPTQEQQTLARRLQQVEVAPESKELTQPWRGFLQSPASLRKAVVLREILGPPKALLD